MDGLQTLRFHIGLFTKKQHMKKVKHELLEQHIDSFPVLPATVTRLIEVTNDPESSAADVMMVIHPDQSLCLTILKIANSALFGRPRRVDSLKMAVTVLGFDEVERIALAKALLNSFSQLSKRHKIIIDRFWAHSFACGMAAGRIAKDTDIAPDIAFLGGLIHDIGKLVMLETFQNDYAAEHWMTGLSDEKMLQDELQTFSFTHDQVGGRLLEQWHFPETVLSAVANHHRPSEAVEGRALANVTQLADLLSFYCCKREFRGTEDIVSHVLDSLPNVYSRWQDCGLPITNDLVKGWFDWLLDNAEQSKSLREVFTS